MLLGAMNENWQKKIIKENIIEDVKLKKKNEIIIDCLLRHIAICDYLNE